MKSTFISKTHIYPAIWALIVALIAFFGGLIWKTLTGPDKVMILNRDDNKDTTVTIVRFQPDEQYFENLNRLTQQSFQRPYAKSNNIDKKKAVDSLAYTIAKEYQLKFDSLRFASKINEFKKPIINDNLISIPNIGTDVNNAQIKRPKFKMPSVVGGYIPEKANSFASFTLNQTEFSRRDKITMTIDFFDKLTLNKITPLYVEIDEIKSTSSVYYIWGDQYEINSKRSILSFSADFKPGNYVLTVGFYFRDEINTKYPPFYSNKYNIIVR